MAQIVSKSAHMRFPEKNSNTSEQNKGKSAKITTLAL